MYRVRAVVVGECRLLDVASRQRRRVLVCSGGVERISMNNDETTLKAQNEATRNGPHDARSIHCERVESMWQKMLTARAGAPMSWGGSQRGRLPMGGLPKGASPWGHGGFGLQLTG